MIDVSARGPAEDTATAVPRDHETTDSLPVRREGPSEPRGASAPAHAYWSEPNGLPSAASRFLAAAALREGHSVCFLLGPSRRIR